MRKFKFLKQNYKIKYLDREEYQYLLNELFSYRRKKRLNRCPLCKSKNVTVIYESKTCDINCFICGKIFVKEIDTNKILSIKKIKEFKNERTIKRR